MATLSSIVLTAILASFSWQHWVLILVLVLVIFGGKRLPELARSLARGMRIFKDEMHGIKTDIEQAGNDTPPSKTLQPPASSPPTNQQAPENK